MLFHDAPFRCVFLYAFYTHTILIIPRFWACRNAIHAENQSFLFICPNNSNPGMDFTLSVCPYFIILNRGYITGYITIKSSFFQELIAWISRLTPQGRYEINPKPTAIETMRFNRGRCYFAGILARLNRRGCASSQPAGPVRPAQAARQSRGTAPRRRRRWQAASPRSCWGS